MDISQITLGFAFLAGLASFLSPCVFSLVPAYIGYLGGRSAASAGSGRPNRWLTLSHGRGAVQRAESAGEDRRRGGDYLRGAHDRAVPHPLAGVRPAPPVGP